MRYRKLAPRPAQRAASSRLNFAAVAALVGRAVDRAGDPVLGRGERRIDRRRPLAVDHLHLLAGIRQDAQIGDAALERLRRAVQVEDADPRAVVLDPGVGDHLLQRLLRVAAQAVLDPGVAPRLRLGALAQERERPAPERRVGVEAGSGAAGRPSSDLTSVLSARGFAQASAWPTATCPALAKLVSHAASGWRSITVTSWPSSSSCQAVVTPTTPAPRTTTCMAALSRAPP